MISTISYLISATLRMGTPIAFTALGGMTSERGGVNNIGLEGIMTASAFGAVVGSYMFQNPWMGIVFAILIGMTISLIHSIVCITWGGTQAVSSMALVLISTGISGVGLKALFNTNGSSPQVPYLPTTTPFEKIPLVGGFLSQLSPFVYIMLLMLFVVWFLFKHTRLGLHIMTVGENPMAAETAGLSVHRIRYFGVIFSGVMGGLGGAMLSIGNMNMFQEDMVAGRGYLALAAVSMGRWNTWGVFGCSMFFGFFSALQLFLQTIPDNPMPAEFIQIIPYLACIIVLAVTATKKNVGIASGGKPYTKFVQQR